MQPGCEEHGPLWRARFDHIGIVDLQTTSAEVSMTDSSRYLSFCPVSPVTPNNLSLAVTGWPLAVLSCSLISNCCHKFTGNLLLFHSSRCIMLSRRIYMTI